MWASFWMVAGRTIVLGDQNQWDKSHADLHFHSDTRTSVPLFSVSKPGSGEALHTKKTGSGVQTPAPYVQQVSLVLEFKPRAESFQTFTVTWCSGPQAQNCPHSCQHHCPHHPPGNLARRSRTNHGPGSQPWGREQPRAALFPD